MEDRIEIPKHIKQYNFNKQIIEQFVGNYDDFMENVRIKTIHSLFLDKYNLNSYVIWNF
jgi:hypothetical protein